MAFFVAADNLMTLFLGLEWFSICLYILTAIAVERLPGLEAGLKYLIVGSFGSAILLFGSAFVYGATGEIGFEQIAAGTADAERLFVVAGLAMIIVGLGFKASAAPFHMWTPDVYEGAPSPVTAFMSAATKVAAVIVTMRVLVTAFPGEEELWTVALAVIVCISLAWGNLAAIVQTGSSGCSRTRASPTQASCSCRSPPGTPSAGGRSSTTWSPTRDEHRRVRRGRGARARAQCPGDARRHGGLRLGASFLGGSMALFMFGFIGLPPTGIFLGKFYAFSAVIDRGWTWLAIVGVVATAVSVYYYAGVIRAMFMQPRELTVAAAGGSPPSDRLLVTAVGACVLVAVGSFVAADPLLDIASDAVASLSFPVR